MKTLGLIGGISWVSTIDYYRYINRGVNEKLGGINSAQLVMHSFNYNDIIINNNANNWDATLQMLTEAGINLKNSGAEAILFCANTMHLLADKAQEKIGLPLIHIAVTTAAEINKSGFTKVGLLGTKFTMEHDFFTNKLTDAGIEAIIPDEADRAYIHQTLMDELGKNIILPQTRQYYLHVMDKLVAQGAQGIILGCTEIPLLISSADTDIPLFDTTLIHSQAAVAFALGE
ncbi:MAG: aspartate/glutamate racemase family protein [Sphingobacteriales bacterium]|nr:MAG: aspartate/glutamate racemase family protein [Sphingobacteriales bacterium]